MVEQRVSYLYRQHCVQQKAQKNSGQQKKKKNYETNKAENKKGIAHFLKNSKYLLCECDKFYALFLYKLQLLIHINTFTRRNRICQLISLCDYLRVNYDFPCFELFSVHNVLFTLLMPNFFRICKYCFFGCLK